MKQIQLDTIARVTGAHRAKVSEAIQELWSGYGEIVRVALTGAPDKSVVVKHVQLPQSASHPRGWNTDISHERKINSYKVETAWYKQWAKRCDDSCRIPHCVAVETVEEEVLIVLEDLDEAGYSARITHATLSDMQLCLSWLAHFHATYMGEAPTDLWETGTYWHLATRPDELAILKKSSPQERALAEVAEKIDALLSGAKYQSFVHGDAKLANFCFSEEGTAVAGVDFQYVGGGCGMKDVAYFIGSCLYEEDCEKYEEHLLDYYFNELSSALALKKPTLDAQAGVGEWRNLYHLAWTDFHRFVKGWSPGHWKIHSYSERIAREVVEGLGE